MSITNFIQNRTDSQGLKSAISSHLNIIRVSTVHLQTPQNQPLLSETKIGFCVHGLQIQLLETKILFLS